jgi:hypothetical protein
MARTALVLLLAIVALLFVAPVFAEVRGGGNL